MFSVIENKNPIHNDIMIVLTYFIKLNGIIDGSTCSLKYTTLGADLVKLQK